MGKKRMEKERDREGNEEERCREKFTAPESPESLLVRARLENGEKEKIRRKSGG